MCGASLAHPPIATKPSVREVPAATVPANGSEKETGNGNGNAESVHGPSFLGLSEDPKTEFHYLYEDELPRSHVGLIFVVVLLLGAAAFGTWQYRHHGFPFNRFGAGSGSAQSASPSEVAPAQTQEQQTHIDKPMTGAGDVLPTQPDQSKQPDTGKTSEFPAQGGQAPADATNTPPNAAVDNQQASAESPTPKPKTEEAKAAPPPEVSASRSKKSASRVPAPKPAPAVAPAAKTAPDADLELAGERYLYGTGVPQNCTRAESSLRTAATHGNSKAQTVLGTMYATGHCVGRDLPTAYRWFARALHQDPQNTRISADLQVLWRQMTPQEKQLATTNGQ